MADEFRDPRQRHRCRRIAGKKIPRTSRARPASSFGVSRSALACIMCMIAPRSCHPGDATAGATLSDFLDEQLVYQRCASLNRGYGRMSAGEDAQSAEPMEGRAFHGFEPTAYGLPEATISLRFIDTEYDGHEHVKGKLVTDVEELDGRADRQPGDVVSRDRRDQVLV